MKVVILAAGKGTRMLPLTQDIPKVLVEVNGKPFLYYVMKNLQQAGYEDFCVVVGYKKEKIFQFLGGYEFKAQTVEQKEQLGTGHALLQAKEFCGQDDFILLGGDNLWSLEDLQALDKKSKYNFVCGREVEHPEKYGVLVQKNGFLQEIVEKPDKFVGNLINTGLYKFKPEIFSALSRIKPSSRGELELTDAVSLLAREKKVKVLKAQEWIDLGSRSDIPLVEKYLHKNWRE